MHLEKAARGPDFQLAQSLCQIAQLLRADLGIRIFVTELGGGGIGGFDNHALQRDNHAALLHELSESLAAIRASVTAISCQPRSRLNGRNHAGEFRIPSPRAVERRTVSHTRPDDR